MKKFGLLLAVVAMLALCACQPTQEHTHQYEEKVTALHAQRMAIPHSPVNAGTLIGQMRLPQVIEKKC